jgi:LacI family transcriptional regulator
MTITLEEIAQRAGVSRATASRALHGTYPVKAETKQRIAKLAKELDYQPNLAARSLRTERTCTIGIVVDDISSPFSPLIVHGIHDALRQNGYVSLIINTERQVETEIDAMHDLLGRSIDGIILVESFLQRDRVMPDLAGKPFVFVHRLFNSGVGNCVMVDEQYGTRLAVEHLIHLGHRKIAHITGPKGWDATNDRLTYFRETMTRAGLPLDEALIREGDWEIEGGYAAAQALLTVPERPTAIFAANDSIAVGTMYAIQEAGLRVPDDISVIGYDNLPSATIIRPKLSTVTMPCYDMGQTGAKLLIRQLANHALPDEQIKVRGELIIRDTTGIPVLSTLKAKSTHS